MKRITSCFICLGVGALLAGSLINSMARADQPTSYAPVAITEDFTTTMNRMKEAKAGVNKRQQDLLNERYDLGDHPASGVTMFRGKPEQAGNRWRT